MPRDRLKILDTTLRDGADDPRFDAGPETRLAIAAALGAAGVDVIEVAHHDAPEPDAVHELVETLERSAACVIGPADSASVENAIALLEPANRRRIHLYATTSAEADLPLALEAIWAARMNVDEVEFSPFKAFDQPLAQIVEHALAASDSGATVINLSDTLGEASPDDVRACFERLGQRLDASCATSFHGHDRTGRAVENAVAAVDAGAQQVHVSLRGVGLRGGNTDLEALLDALGQDESHLAAGPLAEASKLVAQAIG